MYKVRSSRSLLLREVLGLLFLLAILMQLAAGTEPKPKIRPRQAQRYRPTDFGS